MCSMMNGLNHLMFHFGSQSSNSTSTSQGDLVEWCIALTFVARLTAYIALLVLLVVVIFMILRHLWDFDVLNDSEETRASEISPLMPSKAMSSTYGTCQDIETGESSSSTRSSSSSEELYDGKICIICFDEERNCFFVPCGHCATCYDCAQRIFNGDNKTCPVCRRFIGKVRRLFSP